MTSRWPVRCAPCLVGAAMLLSTAWVLAAGGRAKSAAPLADGSVELFAAIEKGQIDVKIFPKDSTQSRIVIANKTDKPLSIKLPDAFGAVPVLAQAAGGAPAAGGGHTHGGSNQEQSVGGGMMGGMGGGGMGGGGMGMFNIAPEKVGQLKATTVCLEHGKREPRPNVPYQIKPIEQVTDKAMVQEVCRMVGSGLLAQRAAQVAAWHLNNNMTWEQLASKQWHFANGTTAPYFTAQELQAGMQAVAVATRLVEQHKQQSAPSGSNSFSQQ
jgi:hypothetical protein